LPFEPHQLKVPSQSAGEARCARMQVTGHIRIT